MEKNYLDKLKFSEQDLKHWSAKYLANVRLMILFLVFLLAFGIWSFFSLPRELNPAVQIPFVFISTALPGAAPTEVENLITIKLENELKSLKKVNKITSNSMENISLIYVEFNNGVDPDEAERKVIQAINKVADLPSDAFAPQVQKLDFENRPVWTFTLEGDQDLATLNNLSEILKKNLEADSLIDRVEITTSDSREIQIILEKKMISQLNLNPFLLISSLKESLVSYPAGAVNSGQYSFPLTIDKNINTLDDLRQKKVIINGQSYILSEIAEIYSQEKINQKKAYQVESNSDIKEITTFSVYKNSESKINQAVAKAQKIVQNALINYSQFKTNTIYDFADEVDQQFNDLTISFLETIFLVFLVMLLFVGLKEAWMAAASIPLAVLATLIVMKIVGITINFISLFSLLLALGLLVDNAIVIVSAVSSYYKTKKFTPFQTAVLVWRDFFEALLANNITTVWAFLPLLLTSGIMGEFIKPVPIVVSVSIISSALIVFLITLPLFTILLKWQIPVRVRIFLIIVSLVFLNIILYIVLPKSSFLFLTFIVFYLLLFLVLKNLFLVLRSHKINEGNNPSSNSLTYKFNHGFINLEKLENFYLEKLKYILISVKNRFKLLVMIIIFTIFAYALPILGIVKNEFFPKGDSSLLYLQIELPSGINMETASEEIKKELTSLSQLSVIDYVIGEMGKSSPTSGVRTPATNNNLLFTLALKDKKDRVDSSMKIAQDLREKYKKYQNGKVSIYELSNGPPAGGDLQLSILGDDLETLATLGEKLKILMNQEKGVVNLDLSLKDNLSKLVFIPDQNKLAEYGLTYQTLGFFLRTLISGFKIDSFDYDGQEYDLTLRFNQKNELSEELVSLNIPTLVGNIPLLALGQLKMQNNPLFINREDFKRSITLAGSVEKGFNIPELAKKMENYALKHINLPTDYQLQTGGVNKENEASVTSIFQAMLLSALLILATLVIQLKSFRKAFIVMSVIPVAISGVFFNFAIFKISLSFPSLIGILSLFGIVVNNSILIVEKINQNLDIGLEFLDSILDACRTRLEPILLTTLTTIFGLIPITLSDPMWQGLGGSIIAGLSFSGILLLFFIPVLFYILFNNDKKIKKVVQINNLFSRLFLGQKVNF